MRPQHLTHATANHFLRHYCQQAGGGSFPVFAGAPYQTGAGLGNIFRSIARFLLPVLAPTATTFIRSAAQGLEEGNDIGSALKGSIAPTVKQALGSTMEQVQKRQSGGGKRRRRSRRIMKKKRDHKSLYKAKNSKRGHKRKSKSGKRKKNRSKVRQLQSINF